MTSGLRLFDSRLLNPAFDFANAVQIVIHRGPVARAEFLLQIGRLLHERSRMLRSCCLRVDALGGIRALSEHPLENFSRIDFHRKRRRGRPPGKRVHVNAAVVAVACADQSGMIFGSEFHRGKQRVLADVLRGDLIGRDARIGVGTLRRFRPNAAEPRCGTQRMHCRRIRGLMSQTADDVHVLRGTVRAA